MALDVVGTYCLFCRAETQSHASITPELPSSTSSDDIHDTHKLLQLHLDYLSLQTTGQGQCSLSIWSCRLAYFQWNY